MRVFTFHVGVFGTRLEAPEDQIVCMHRLNQIDMKVQDSAASMADKAAQGDKDSTGGGHMCLICQDPDALLDPVSACSACHDVQDACFIA